VIALDTNILVYAHRLDSPDHAVATARLTEVAETSTAWAIPWSCLHEFVGVVTNARIFVRPTPLAMALDQVDAWLASPSLVALAEPESYWQEFRRVAMVGRIGGPRVHDARIAAICLSHGVRELWSADRDFSRFPGLRVVNPLIG